MNVTDITIYDLPPIRKTYISINLNPLLGKTKGLHLSFRLKIYDPIRIIYPETPIGYSPDSIVKKFIKFAQNNCYLIMISPALNKTIYK
ncbi:MAG: hypothetical protein DRP00_05535, partial [Candidatus Aenigmatarchaeota archaeon]